MLILVLLSSMTYAQESSNDFGIDSTCPEGEQTVQVPAVVGGQEGGLLELDVWVGPGEGGVYTSISPTVGVSTQVSQQTAVSVAFANLSLHRKDCDVVFSLRNEGESSSVDGPSAGLAMTVALRAALTGATVRPDVIITGAILPDGGVGLVGGLIDKAQAASRGGKHLLITPHQELYESIVMRALGRDHDFAAVQVSNWTQAYAMATSAAETVFNTSFKLENRPIPANLTIRPSNEDDARLAQVALAINDELARKVEAGATGPLAAYQQYFAKELEQNRRLAEEGYAYTSANNAFLSQVDADFLTTPTHALDVKTQIHAVQDCLARMPDAWATDTNFEWVAGAKARAAWAQRKVQDVSEAQNSSDGSSEEQYGAVRELYYAKAWCEAGGYMMEQAGQMGGQRLDGSVLAVQARESVRQAGAEVQGLDADEDAHWHWSIANHSLSQGDYLAALYDAAYSEGAQQMHAEQAENATDLENRSVEISQAPMRTLWGRTYQSQGVFIRSLAAQNLSSPRAADEVLRLAAFLEEGMRQASLTIHRPGGSVEVGDGANRRANGRATDFALSLLVLLSISVLSLQVGRQIYQRAKR
jgi:predicted S18 family serine protease